MAKHEVLYDGQGIAQNHPWSLDDYLSEDGLMTEDRARVKESVLSWLREYEAASESLQDAMRELAEQVDI